MGGVGKLKVDVAPVPDWDGETQEFETLDELVRKMEEVREAMPLLGAPQ